MNGRKKFGRMLGAAGALMMVGALVMGPSMAQAENDQSVNVYWDGNGTTGYGTTAGATCDTLKSDPDMSPAAGQQGWHFVLTSPFDGNVVTNLTYVFSPSPSGAVQGIFHSDTNTNGAYHFYVYAPIGATLVSAWANNGTNVWHEARGNKPGYWKTKSNLNVSHCERGDDPEEPDNPAIEVTKTVDEIEYDVEYLWTVTKDLDGTVARDVLGNASVPYEVVVIRSGPSVVADSYTVSGTITVENTGDVPVLITDVTDALSISDAVCDVTPADDFDLDFLLDDNVADTLEFDYTCDVSGTPVNETNTATVDFEYDGEEMSAGSEAETVDYNTAGVNDTFDATATLTDDQYASINQTLSGGGTFNYTITVEEGGSNCSPGFTNTATIRDLAGTTLDSDFETVPICSLGEEPEIPVVVENLPPVPETPVVDTPVVVVMPPVPAEAPQSGALPQTGWTGTNLTLLLGLAMLAAGGLAIGFTRRSAKS